MINDSNIDASFWSGKRVFVTGHNGFKGSWLSIWLHRLGAKVTGFSLPPSTTPSLYELGKIGELIDQSILGDITKYDDLCEAMQQAKPDIVFHMAAQPLVRKSYDDPIATYQTNVMGTVHLLEAARSCESVRAIVNVTTDKCYENQEWYWGYRENDRLGGYDPYSNSKACAELVTSAYRQSFLSHSSIHVATVRAGNVIGGGDWSEDRLIPDLMRSLLSKQAIILRNPEAVRPWQHVLEPLSGYLMLAKRLYEDGAYFAQGWNFGPRTEDVQTVQYIVEQLLSQWQGEHPGYEVERQEKKHEAKLLMLDCSKAISELEWKPQWGLKQALDMTLEWFQAYNRGENLLQLCQKQITQYESAAVSGNS
ncbi:MAG: CDP-glucose 4,6-dehydratase [Candidatus Pristimantibacillus lignocellulolyticus]|uniref:CDP-glucose 4,6-dehydratase n=1 Tax=Candidatus Pristimantibacillus lignocellulolyticus TaxID=2994561 RepID=A0A9J6ZH69_9BACL|nr:MAG: CDP-glucose 4,6-dehydratase [Candidatus Pristimantibacillus lignocellulolyticus]